MLGILKFYNGNHMTMFRFEERALWTAADKVPRVLALPKRNEWDDKNNEEHVVCSLVLWPLRL